MRTMLRPYAVTDQQFDRPESHEIQDILYVYPFRDFPQYQPIAFDREYGTLSHEHCLLTALDYILANGICDFLHGFYQLPYGPSFTTLRPPAPISTLSPDVVKLPVNTSSRAL